MYGWQQKSEVWDFFEKDGPKIVRYKVFSSQGTVLAYLEELFYLHMDYPKHCFVRFGDINKIR